MRHLLKKYTRPTVLALSLASVLAAILLGARSYATLDELSHAGATGTVESVVSFRGGLHFARGGMTAGDRGWSHDKYRITPGSDWDVLYFTGELKFRFLGFGWLQGKPFGGMRPFGNVKSVPLTPWLNIPPYNAVVVPHWFVAIVLAAPWWWPRVVGPLVQRFRRMPGMCPHCGYDIRATPVRCPECGFVPQSKADGPAVAPSRGDA